MLSKSSWLHLRIPFSYFLLPVYLFALAVSPNPTTAKVLWTLIIVHIFLYPASNGYNSYYDKDEQSIGGLKHPLPVNKGLYYLSLTFDALAILLGIVFINLTFGLLLFVYGLASKAYSYPGVRLKKYPIWGWFVAGFFQGLFTLVMCYIGINNYGIENVLKPQVLLPGLLSSIMIWANYPMTQIYQHEEDGKRGDHTFSIMLGIRGTFYFVAAVFGIVSLGFALFFRAFYNDVLAIRFLIALSPVTFYFVYWFIKAYNNPKAADYDHTMWLNFISATCLNLFFGYMFLSNSHYLQLLIP
ncbi:MAG: UbiA family prenyltransferase [Chryseolinea sp.]